MKDISKINDFVALDVETAQGPRCSICQIGLAIVKNKKIFRTYSFYVRPPENKYSLVNTKIHGISSEITENEPIFPIVWEKVYRYIENNLVIAHNSNFDIDCIKQTLSYYNLTIPKIKSDCTYKRSGRNLNDLCEAYNIELKNHHDAEADAIACANIFLKMIDNIKPDFSEVTTKSKVNYYQNNYEGHERLQGSILKPDYEQCDRLSPFFKKKVVFTGVLNSISRQEAAYQVKKLGADIDTNISKRTNIVITGQSPGPSKMKKIIKFNNEGSDIKIIKEDDFLNLLK
jgi:DNA polymerase-3 subunit epsilon